MPTIRARPHGKGKASYCVERIEDNQTDPSGIEIGKLESSGVRQRIARALGTEPTILLQLYNRLASGEATAEHHWTTPAPPTLRYSVRRIEQPEREATYYADLQAAMAEPVTDAVCYWEGTEEVCRLDVDYHSMPRADRPDAAWIARKIDALEPRPIVAWVTPGNGVAAIYRRQEGHTADELAAVAGLNWCGMDRTATVELKSSFRLPVVNARYLGQTSDLSAIVGGPRADLSQEQIDDWLSVKGFTVGASYEHSYCPVRPEHSSHGTPVFVGERGIFCHSCNGNNVTRGSRKPGWFPYRSLVDMGGRVDSLLITCARSFCHWGHARFVFAEKYPNVPESIARLAYRALCRALHRPDDPRIRAVLTVLRGDNLVRRAGLWVTQRGEPYKENHLTAIINTLPAAQSELGPTPARAAALLQGFDLTDYGYPPVTPIRGHRIYGHHLEYADRRRVTMPICDPDMPTEYIPQSQRMPFNEIASVYEDMFAGINWSYLRLLIVGRGIAEGATGRPVLIVVDGPAGAGKSNTVHVAASSCGDVATEVTFTTDTTRLRQSVLDATQRGGYCVCNEIMKDGMRAGLSPVESLDPILNLTPHSVSHQMYVGPVPLGALPAFVFTDVTIPPEIREDVQLARRLVHVRLHSRVCWDTALVRHGLSSPADFRASSPLRRFAADSLVSWIVDEYFSEQCDFTTIAQQLGFPPLEQSEEYDNPEILLKRMFELVCDEQAMPDGYRSWLGGAGWKLIRRNDKSELVEVWRALCDGEGEAFARSRACAACDWRLTLGVNCDEPIHFDVSRHRETGICAVRFRVGPKKKPIATNGEILELRSSQGRLRIL